MTESILFEAIDKVAFDTGAFEACDIIKELCHVYLMEASSLDNIDITKPLSPQQKAQLKKEGYYDINSMTEQDLRKLGVPKQQNIMDFGNMTYEDVKKKKLLQQKKQRHVQQ